MQFRGAPAIQLGAIGELHDYSGPFRPHDFAYEFFSRVHQTTMPFLGAHMSIAGGYYKAVEAAASFQMDCVQVFTKNPSNQ